MFTHFFAGCLLAAVAAPGAPTPDVVVPNTRSIKVEMRVNAQQLIDHCCVQHVVLKGETLTKIAAAHRAAPHATSISEILALNPGLKADKLAVGQRIWMPPRVSGLPGAEMQFVFTSSHWHCPVGISAFAPKAKISASRYGVFSLVLVSESGMREWSRALAANKGIHEAFARLQEAGEIQSIEQRCTPTTVWNESPVYSCVDSLTIARSRKGEYSLGFSSVAYDKGGKVVPPKERVVERRRSDQQMSLLFLPMLGAGWLCIRRRRQPAAGLAAS